MGVNVYKPHLYILPEDRAYEQLANGFVDFHGVNPTQINIRPSLGGWTKVVESYQSTFKKRLVENPHCHVVLLIDFDRDAGRRSLIESEIPHELYDRVFLFGPLMEAEDLKKLYSSTFEQAGKAVAEACVLKNDAFWQQPLLEDNLPAIHKFSAKVMPWLTTK